MSTNPPNVGIAAKNNSLPFTDIEVVDALTSRAAGAETRFVIAYDPSIRRIILTSSAAARPNLEDLVNDVYAHLWRDDFHVLRQWGREDSLLAYLRTVIRRLVWVRLARSHPSREQLENSPAVLEDVLHRANELPATPEEELLVNQRARFVRSTLAGLDARDREILEFYYFEDLSYREIAAVVSASTNCVGVRIARALKRLKAKSRQSAGSADYCMLTICFVPATGCLEPAVSDQTSRHVISSALLPS